jgi:hypothetical protein
MRLRVPPPSYDSMISATTPLQSFRAEDDDAGYSVFSTGEGLNDPTEVELTPEHPR